MDKADEMKKSISNDPDFVMLPRYGCSLKRVLERYPDGVPSTSMAAKALDISEAEYDAVVAGAMEKLKTWF